MIRDPIFGLAAQDFKLWHLTAIDFGAIGNKELYGWMRRALQLGNRLKSLRSVHLTTFWGRRLAAANWAPLVFEELPNLVELDCCPSPVL